MPLLWVLTNYDPVFKKNPVSTVKLKAVSFGLCHVRLSTLISIHFFNLYSVFSIIRGCYRVIVIQSPGKSQVSEIKKLQTKLFLLVFGVLLDSCSIWFGIFRLYSTISSLTLVAYCLHLQTLFLFPLLEMVSFNIYPERFFLILFEISFSFRYRDDILFS